MAFACPAANAAPDDQHAVILLYHHVSESTPASTSVSPAVFESHLDYLEKSNFRVLPLADIVSALKDKRPLPPRAVAITFDDGYQSILTEAMPRIAKRGWPFTVFVSTDAIDEGYATFMSWPDLRRIEAGGGTIANHTASHEHLVRRRPGESAAAWRRRVATDIESAQSKLESELDNPLRLFAWPFGEFDADLEELAGKLGLVAFGQQSGPAGRASSPQSLPRFPMATGFADLDSFAEKLRTRPLPVTVLSPASRVLQVPARPPQLTIRIPDGPYRLAALRCYVGGQEPAEISRRGDVFTVQAKKPLRPGRGKFNCTAPSSEENGVFYWYSHLWLQREDDGGWYTE
jgi:peptidoglycan/xylan/chitin deacetylase (PgdA/CDA1 family)